MMRFLRRSYLTLILIFLYAPILVLIVYSFNDSKTMGNWGGFTFRWYAELFQDPEILNALFYTVVIALLTALISMVIGTIAAIGIHYLPRVSSIFYTNITYLPILNPDIVTGISLMVLYLSMQMELGFVTLLLSHITFSVPYVIFSVLPKLRQLSPNTYEAALDLGAKPMKAIWQVTIPEIMPGIITGGILAFTLSLDDFVISFFTTAGIQNLSILVYSMARRGINPAINALSALMFVCVLALLLIVNKRSGEDAIDFI